MKVIFASTPEQQVEIQELINHLYSEVFPNYFSDQEISRLKQQQVLKLSSSHMEQLDTLKDAYQVIASLQTIISILENSILDDQYIETFYKNVTILEDYGLNFPLDYHQFSDSELEKDNNLSMYTKAANTLLV